MKKCGNKKCDGYDEEYADNCDASGKQDVDTCKDYLIAKTAPVAEVPCSAGLSAAQLTEPGYYWWLPQCDIDNPDEACWSVVHWHPKVSSSIKGLFVGPLKKPSR